MIDAQAIRDTIALTRYLAVGFTAGVLTTLAAQRLRTYLARPSSRRS